VPGLRFDPSSSFSDSYDGLKAALIEIDPDLAAILTEHLDPLLGAEDDDARRKRRDTFNRRVKTSLDSRPEEPGDA